MTVSCISASKKDALCLVRPVQAFKATNLYGRVFWLYYVTWKYFTFGLRMSCVSGASCVYVSDLTLGEMYIVQKATTWIHWKTILKGDPQHRHQRLWVRPQHQERKGKKMFLAGHLVLVECPIRGADNFVARTNSRYRYPRQPFEVAQKQSVIK